MPVLNEIPAQDLDLENIRLAFEQLMQNPLEYLDNPIENEDNPEQQNLADHNPAGHIPEELLLDPPLQQPIVQ
ncbi:hypothetical protein C0992_012064, partial [Termitomyces sp. T32_za158]